MVAESSTSACEHSVYDEAEFLNSVKNGKNAVLSAVIQKGTAGAGGSTSLGASERDKKVVKPSNMSSGHGDFVMMAPVGLKDVMKMITMKRGSRSEESNANSSSIAAAGGGKTRRTLGELIFTSFSF